MSQCNQCGHDWEPLPTNPNPKCCPRCKRYDWWEQKKVGRGVRAHDREGVGQVVEKRTKSAGLCEHGNDPKFCRLGVCPTMRGK